jgi:hypothetical protein
MGELGSCRVVAHTAADDPGLIGVILISAWNAGRPIASHRAAVAEMADNMESLAGVTAEAMATELETNSRTFGLEETAKGLARVPLLALTADDGLARDTDALVKAIAAKGENNVKAFHAATDHSWPDRRIFLESTIIAWLGGLP